MLEVMFAKGFIWGFGSVVGRIIRCAIECAKSGFLSVLEGPKRRVSCGIN